MAMHLKNQNPEAFISSHVYKTGEEIRLGGESYHILAIAGRGRRSIVYQIKDGGGQRRALKVATDLRPETIASIKNERMKALAYTRYGFKHAEVISGGPDFVIKRWVDGTRGDEWTREWAKTGCPPNSPQFIRLVELIHRSAAKKIYLQDLNQNNLIWDGTDWIIIDTGSIKKRFSSSRILRLYREYISENWGRSTSPDCGEVFRRLLPRKVRAY
ncbi:MAG: hypothetical protein RAO92_02105 [Candidatus Euphemobacter frigidus]|nr:hypothetical protein [Candidatus Euphemobacter frigidus]MDP8275176.1 hypothetical protein [Candidatus Euphemobacter frigidus]